MLRPSRAAFTLVELLVVITIIAMLMALLIPAANMFIESGKRTSCLNNIHQIAEASLIYETNKTHFPPERTDSGTIINSSTPGNVTLTWAGVLVPYLGRGDIAGGVAYMPIYVCPSNPPDTISDANPALSYSCNAGKKNGSPSQTIPSDWKDNGVFMDYRKGYAVDNVTKDFINRNDGLATTFMLMESLYSGTWDNVNNEMFTGMVWPHSISVGATPDNARVNDPTVLRSTSQPAQAIISSKHPGGANIAFCDSHTIFLSDQVDPIVIELAMTPNGRGVKNVSSTAIVGQNIKPASGATGFSETDLIK
ncbi:MAG TPA: DUF1559 domain-containing protein [Pirellulales bacterium]|jgi:prepilin-type N-terminal cleavage/methylation domain-containing protein/prepilin-type processing-associated H-X9-DG protein|nr:DUF1559 domain-containing protein [Pirellulales bacterium]